MKPSMSTLLVLSVLLLVVTSSVGYVPENDVVAVMLIAYGPYTIGEQANETIVIKNYTNYTMVNVSVSQLLPYEKLRITKTPFGYVKGIIEINDTQIGIPGTPCTNITVLHFWANSTYFELTVDKLEIGDMLSTFIFFEYVGQDSDVFDVPAANVSWYDNWMDFQSKLTNKVRINYRTPTSEDLRASYITVPTLDSELQKKIILVSIGVAVFLPILNILYFRRR